VPTIHAQKLGLGRIKLLAQLHQTTDERYPTTHDFKHVWGMKNEKAGICFYKLRRGCRMYVTYTFVRHGSTLGNVGCSFRGGTVHGISHVNCIRRVLGSFLLSFSPLIHALSVL
jgi:hypothetical protein